MRFVVVAVFVCAGCGAPGMSGSTGGAEEAPRPTGRDAVEAARELDQQGVASYRAGRYADAVAYFRASYARGGPPSELWNIVRCREAMDDAEGATSAIDEYLGIKGLSASDRADAAREAQALRARPSALTVTTSPPGAAVAVDGKAAGATPLSTTLRPGEHSVVARLPGYRPATRTLSAALGRAVIVTLDLERADK